MEERNAMPPLFSSPNHYERLSERSQEETAIDMQAVRPPLVHKQGRYHLSREDARPSDADADPVHEAPEECPRCLTVLSEKVGPKCPVCGTYLICG